MPQIMDTSVYFEKISEEISKHLEAATHDIVIANGQTPHGKSVQNPYFNNK